VTCASGSKLVGTQVSGPLVVRMIDEFPALAVAAAFAEGETLVTQAEELRLKESDRISAICQEFTRLGIQVREMQDGFIVKGGLLPMGGRSGFARGPSPGNGAGAGWIGEQPPGYSSGCPGDQ
jgi:5-enolpyruvylshikimate-3-phosphate synthase